MATRARVQDVKLLSCGAAWRNYHFVKITTEDGIVGWSEFDEDFGSPSVGYVISKLAHRVVGQSVMNHELIHTDLFAVTRPGSGGVIGQALGAIENAVLDAKAKTLGVPCYELLGGKMRDRLRVYWSHAVTWRASRRPHYQPEITDADGVRSLAREVREKGFTALKTNIYRYDNGIIRGWAPGFGTPYEPGYNMEKNIRRGVKEHIGVLREAGGPDVDILLDLNFNARTEGYVAMLRELANEDLFWVEIDTLAPEALAFIRSQSQHPIASCETLIGLQQFLPFFRAQAIDVAIIDTPWNGVWQSMKIAAAAEAHEVNVACHNFYGHLCTFMNVHFCAAVPNLRIMETDIDRVVHDHELFTDVPEYVAGHIVVPDRPGWGCEPNEDAMRKYPPLKLNGFADRVPRPTLA
jgi:L-alanine-DL-glutamate epimerase-like enolase superfamily enzyme